MDGNLFATHITGPVLVKNPDFVDVLIGRIFEVKGWELPEQLPVLPYEREAYDVTLRELSARVKEN
jgi:CobQ-like glutamine amidotransferase family enzyme